MGTLLIALAAGVGFLVAYHTYGRWLGHKIFQFSSDLVCPSERLRDGNDYVPTPSSVVFGHHFTSIAGTGPIVGPAIAILWGWLPALLWVVFGSIFIGAVHDLGALAVSLRNNGQTIGDIAGRVLNKRVRVLFLLILFMALTIVLAIFGLVIAAVFKMYGAAIFPCLVQIPIAIAIGFWLYRKGAGLLLPSLLALGLMYVSVAFGDWGPLHAFNQMLKDWPIIVWVIVLLVYSYIASVLPVWLLLQPRDYINSLQLISALGLIIVGIVAASFFHGAPPTSGAERPALEIVAPMINLHPDETAPPIFPFLFITIACGAVSGFHCLVSSGTSSKQLRNEKDARMVGYGAMVTEGFLATLVILACVAGIGMGFPLETGKSFRSADGASYEVVASSDAPGAPLAVRAKDSSDGALLLVGKPGELVRDDKLGVMIGTTGKAVVVGEAAWKTRYGSWKASDAGLDTKVGAFVNGSANFLTTLGIPEKIAIALMGVLVASFAGTTLDTACRLQRYVVQELAACFLPKADVGGAGRVKLSVNPLTWLCNKHGATIFAVATAAIMAAFPPPGASFSWANAGKGGTILWPMFGATNQLLAGLSFLVIAFYLWRRSKPIWFLVLPLVFMLVMPAWAMLMQLPKWISPDQGSPNWMLIGIAVATLLLEAWMIVEGVLLMPKAKGVLEQTLPGAEPEPQPEPARVG